MPSFSKIVNKTKKSMEALTNVVTFNILIYNNFTIYYVNATGKSGKRKSEMYGNLSGSSNRN